LRTLIVRSPAAESNSTSATGKPSAIAVNPLWRVTGCSDSRLRYGRQCDPDARASGRVQRVVMGSLVKPKETLAVCGFTILAVGLSCLGYVQWLWFRAIRLDNHFQYLAGGPCTHPLKHVDIPRRVISENDSESILIVLSNNGRNACQATVHPSARRRCAPSLPPRWRRS